MLFRSDGTGQIGPSRAHEVALNVFVPFAGGEAWRRAAGGPPPPVPGALRRAFGARITTVRRYFGALRAAKSHFSFAPPPGAC